MSRVRRILNLRPGEGVPVLLLFTYLTFTLTSFIISKSVRDALFLREFGAMRLPLVYVAVAVLIGVIVSIYIRVSHRISQLRLITGTLLFFMANIVVLWWAIRVDWKPIPVVYYMWANVFGIILTAQVWTLAASILSTHQARRLFPLICSGGILGSLLGGVIAAVGAKRIGADNLILIPLALLALSIPVVHLVARHHRLTNRNPHLEKVETGNGDSSLRSVLKATLETRYLRLIASLLALSAIVSLIVDFQFKLVVQQSFASKDAMAAFFGSFYAYVGLFSFVVQFFAGSRFFEKYGLRLALLLLPMTLVGGTAALLAYPTVLWAGILLKGSDGVLRLSVDRSSIEMLYIPVPQDLRLQVKAVIDMLIQRLSDGLGGIFLLIITHFLGVGLAGVGVINLALLGVWIWIARQTRQEYKRVRSGMKLSIPKKEVPAIDTGIPAPESKAA